MNSKITSMIKVIVLGGMLHTGMTPTLKAEDTSVISTELKRIATYLEVGAATGLGMAVLGPLLKRFTPRILSQLGTAGSKKALDFLDTTRTLSLHPERTLEKYPVASLVFLISGIYTIYNRYRFHADHGVGKYSQGLTSSELNLLAAFFLLTMNRDGKLGDKTAEAYPIFTRLGRQLKHSYRRMNDESY